MKPEKLTEASSKKLKQLIKESNQSKKFYEAKPSKNKPQIRIRRFD